MTRRCAEMTSPITFDHAEVGISSILRLILSEVRTPFAHPEVGSIFDWNNTPNTHFCLRALS